MEHSADLCATLLANGTSDQASWYGQVRREQSGPKNAGTMLPSLSTVPSLRLKQVHLSQAAAQTHSGLDQGTTLTPQEQSGDFHLLPQLPWPEQEFGLQEHTFTETGEQTIKRSTLTAVTAQGPKGHEDGGRSQWYLQQGD